MSLVIRFNDEKWLLTSQEEILFETKKNIEAKINYFLKEKKLHKTDLAKSLGITIQELNKWFLNFTLENVSKIEDILHERILMTSIYFEHRFLTDETYRLKLCSILNMNDQFVLKENLLP